MSIPMYNVFQNNASKYTKAVEYEYVAFQFRITKAIQIYNIDIKKRILFNI